jgi:hypothetical protein
MIGPAEQRRIEGFAQVLAQAIAASLKEEFGGTHVQFVVLLSTDKDREPGGQGFSTYVAGTKDRESMVQMLREMAAKVEADPRTGTKAYLRAKDAPQRFDVQRVEDVAAALGTQRIQIPEVPGGASLLISANGRFSGVLVLSAEEERALKERLFGEEGPRKPEPTKLRLARVLREHGLEQMAEAAEHGRYDDYQSESATPCIDLVNHLHAAGAHELAERAKRGEWDATKEEADAWAASPDGHAAFAQLIGAQSEQMRAAEEKRRRRAEKLRAQVQKRDEPPEGPNQPTQERVDADSDG